MAETIHSHNEEEHDELVDEVRSLCAELDDLYINHHNGVKELNKRIMLPRDRAKVILVKLRGHVKNNKNIDIYAEAGVKAEQRRVMMQERFKTALWTLAGSISILLISKYLIL